MGLWRHIAERIGAASGTTFTPRKPRGLSGGCINSAFRLHDGERQFFIKTNSANLLDMFEAEALGLTELAASDTLRVPRAVCTGATDGVAFIVMEYLDLGRGSRESWRRAGTLLAELHNSGADRFGWRRDNTIGSTPQSNTWAPDWTDFWRNQRLGYQLELAARNGHRGRLQTLGAQLMERFPALLDHSPQPSLLHGDLWGGNLAFGRDGIPVIYDPATYFGDREAELAMTELFGGFSPEFYAAYRDAWPLDAGFRVRKTLYNLYHVLNHLNLFGGGYGGQATRMMEQLLAEC